MLNQAKHKNTNIDWIIGTAENTGLNSNSISGITAFLTIHHWTNIEQGFKELNRILIDDGQIVIFTSTPNQMKKYWLNHYFPKMLSDSSKQMPSLKKIETAMKNTGLKIVSTEPYSIKPELQDLFLYSGKHNPKLYLKPEIRNGISSFADLANATEVKEGLNQLKGDIKMGIVNKVIESYNNTDGDYLFMKAKKI